MLPCTRLLSSIRTTQLNYHPNFLFHDGEIEYAMSSWVAMQVVLMSATLDSTLFSSYLGGCPVVAAGGRTFPVQHLFLEDVHDMTGYLLDPDSPAAYRTRSDKQRQKQLQKQTVSQAHLGLVQVNSHDPYMQTMMIETSFAGIAASAVLSSARASQWPGSSGLGAGELSSPMHDDDDDGNILCGNGCICCIVVC